MKEKQLTITIGGRSNSGKSRVLFLIKNMLRMNGFDVKHDGGMDFSTEKDFDEHMSIRTDDVLKHIQSNTTIIMKENQSNLSAMSNDK